MLAHTRVILLCPYKLNYGYIAFSSYVFTLFLYLVYIVNFKTATLKSHIFSIASHVFLNFFQQICPLFGKILTSYLKCSRISFLLSCYSQEIGTRLPLLIKNMNDKYQIGVKFHTRHFHWIILSPHFTSQIFCLHVFMFVAKKVSISQYKASCNYNEINNTFYHYVFSQKSSIIDVCMDIFLISLLVFLIQLEY